MAGSVLGVYTHSGKLGLGPILVPIGAFIAAVALGVAYAYVDVYVPIAGYISILFVMCVLLGLAATISGLGYVARCRSEVFLHLVGLIAGAFTLYVSWAAFMYALLKRSDVGFQGSLLDVFSSPRAIWAFVKAVNSEGWYTVFGFTPKGAVLWTFWIIEAGIIVFGTALAAAGLIGNKVFCERCNRWCTTTKSAAQLAVPEGEAQLSKLQPDSLSTLMSLGPATASTNPHIRLDTWHCRKCTTTAALKARVCSFTVDKKGKREEKTEDLTPVWLVSPETLQEVKALAGRPTA